jgi:hypothetical protein
MRYVPPCGGLGNYRQARGLSAGHQEEWEQSVLSTRRTDS